MGESVRISISHYAMLVSTILHRKMLKDILIIIWGDCPDLIREEKTKCVIREHNTVQHVESAFGCQQCSKIYERGFKR
jgi:hypothetical protein